MIEFTGKKLTIILTSKCNAKCRHCYVDYSGFWDVSELEELIPILKKKYLISLNGAEPLTNLEYLKLYPLADCKKIFTNGKIITENPNIVDRLKENGIERVCISYHFFAKGFSSVTNKIIEKAIDILTKNKFNVTIMTTITKENYLLLPEICEKVRDFKVDTLALFNYLCKGSGLNYREKYCLSTEQIKIFVDELKRQRKLYSKDELYIHKCGTFDSSEFISTAKFKCMAYKDYTLAPNKKIYPCVFLINEDSVCGNLEGTKIIIDQSLFF